MPRSRTAVFMGVPKRERWSLRKIPNFLVWKFCGKAQFPHSFGRIAQRYAKSVPFHKISTQENYVKLLYFSQWVWFFTVLVLVFKSASVVLKQDPTCIRKPMTNTFDKSTKFLHWLFLVVLDAFRSF